MVLKRKLRDMDVNPVRALPQATGELDGPQVPKLYLLNQAKGRGWVRQRDWEVVLEAGDLVLCIGEAPLHGVEGRGRQDLLAFSQRASGPFAQFLPAHMLASDPSARVLLAVAEALASAEDDLPPDLREKFQAGFLAMLEGAVVHGHPPRERGVSRLTAYHLDRIKAFMRAHLREPDLRVSEVARALDISISHLHRLFGHEGITAGDWLWAERLSNCARELSSPSFAHMGVGEIALNWGFNDLSHFSRAFKKRYGLSPREWRAQAPWRSPLTAKS